jgi:hypothetical protein
MSSSPADGGASSGWLDGKSHSIALLAGRSAPLHPAAPALLSRRWIGGILFDPAPEGRLDSRERRPEPNAREMGPGRRGEP